MILHGYALSSASYRVRIALALKGLEVTTVTKQLRLDEHRQADFLRLNPQGFVPTLSLDDGEVLTQSLAIVEYLDEVYPRAAVAPGRAGGARQSQKLEPTDRLRCTPAEQPAGAQVPRGAPRAGPGRRASRGITTGCGPASMRSSSGSCRIHPPAASATATPRAWQTCAWCRRCSTRGVSRWISAPIRASSRSTRRAANCRLSSARHRSAKARRCSSRRAAPDRRIGDRSATRQRRARPQLR